MVKNVLLRANRSISIGSAAALLSAATFLSAILGLVVRRLLAARFGVGETLDAYYAAFSIPDLIFYLLVSGALTVTLLPVLSERLMSRNKKSAWEISTSILNFLALTTLTASVLIFIFADPLMHLAAPGFDERRHELAVLLMRLLALNPFLFSISSVYASMQQAFGRFFFYALAPIVYNLGIIAGIIFLSPHFDITGVALGAVLGAFAQLVVQRMGLTGLGFEYSRTIFWRNRGFRQVLRLIVPRSIDEGIDNLIAVVERAIASGLGIGVLAAYQFAFDLKNYPIALIGAAIATAVFPKVSERAAGTRPDILKRELAGIFRVILWLIVPVAALVVILRGYIVRLLFGFGGPITASILGWFALAIIFQSLLRMVARVFYAYQDTRTPLYVSLCAIILNVALAFFFVSRYSVQGLAMAQSAVAIFEVLTLSSIIRHRLGSFVQARFFINISKILVATFTMSILAYALTARFLPLLNVDAGFFSLAPKFSLIALVSGVFYVLVSYWLRLPDAVLVINKVRQFAFKQLNIS